MNFTDNDPDPNRWDLLKVESRYGRVYFGIYWSLVYIEKATGRELHGVESVVQSSRMAATNTERGACCASAAGGGGGGSCIKNNKALTPH
jgi:hypothetical protein